MLNLYNYLTEAENAPITYPNLYKPKEVWKIKGNYGYLTASFVTKGYLKWPDLGFNLVVPRFDGGRYLIFLTKEDATLFLKKAYENYSLPALEVVHGRGGKELVRIDNDKIGIPIYITTNSIVFLSKLGETKIPQYIRDRLDGEVEVSSDQKEKEEKQRIETEQQQNFNEKLIKAVKIIDPTYKRVEHVDSIEVKFKKSNTIIQFNLPDSSSDYRYLGIRMHVYFPNVYFGDSWDKKELKSILVPYKEDRDKLNWDNSCVLDDNNYNSILYPKISLRKNWDIDRIVKELNNYLDNVINIVNNYNNIEEFI